MKLAIGKPMQQRRVEQLSFARVIVSIISFFFLLGISRLAVAYLWGLLVPMQRTTDGDFLLSIFNRVSLAIQAFIALALVSLGFSKFNTVALRFGSVDKFLKRSRIIIRLNDIFACLAVLWYGYQSFFQGHNYLVAFFVIETGILFTSLLMMQRLHKKMPKESTTAESDDFFKDKEDAIALSLAHYYLRNGASDGPNVKMLSPLYMQDLSVCFLRNSYYYTLSIKHGNYIVAVTYAGSMPGILPSAAWDDELSVEAKPVIDWIYSVLGVLPDLVSLSEGEVNKANEYRAKANKTSGMRAIAIGVALVIASFILSASVYFKYGHFDFLSTSRFSVPSFVLGIVFIYSGLKATRKKLDK